MANDMEMNFLMNLGGMMDEEAEIIPLLSADEEEVLNNEDSPTELSILPLKNNVLFPGVVIPITVGRDKSIKLVKEANAQKSFGPKPMYIKLQGRGHRMGVRRYNDSLPLKFSDTADVYMYAR